MSGTVSIGELVRRHRLHRGLTQKQLARKAGITHGYITHLETGRRANPSRQMVEKLAKAFDLQGSEKAVFFAAGQYVSQTGVVTPVKLDHPLIKAVIDYLRLDSDSPMRQKAFRQLATELVCTVINRHPSAKDKRIMRGVTNEGVGYYHRTNAQYASNDDQNTSGRKRRLSGNICELLAFLDDGTAQITQRIALSEEMISLAKWRLGINSQAEKT
ncbi:MAG: helix-turn-helix domain-containing protein [Planctomycetes bacterium]|nr:helix-turn-helix domain-containing protein [Planctomycetota bacterium]